MMAQQCFKCQHWTSKNKKGLTHPMAQHRFGLCVHDEDWRYFPPMRLCDKGLFTEKNTKEIKGIIKWLER